MDSLPVTHPTSHSSTVHLPSCPSAAGVTALVFGREESGLQESELRLCSHACAIPTGRIHPSMNLSHAVAVVLHDCFDRRLEALGLTEEGLGLEQPGGYCTLSLLMTDGGMLRFERQRIIDERMHIMLLLFLCVVCSVMCIDPSRIMLCSALP